MPAHKKPEIVKTRTYSVLDSLHAEFVEACRVAGVTQTDVIRAAINQFIAQTLGEKSCFSCTEIQDNAPQ